MCVCVYVCVCVCVSRPVRFRAPRRQDRDLRVDHVGPVILRLGFGGILYK